MTKTALITGITGQDGAYLATFLLNKNYRVIGCYRRSSTVNFWRLLELEVFEESNLVLVDLDITDPMNVYSVVEKYRPDEYTTLQLRVL